eukprot:6855425-Ditylum_brightwellii.AAC.1
MSDFSGQMGSNALKKFQILTHSFDGHDLSLVRIVFVPIDTTYCNLLSIQHEHATRYFDGPKTYATRLSLEWL